MSRRGLILLLLLLLPLPAVTDGAVAISDEERRAIRAQLAEVMATSERRFDRFDAEVWLQSVEPPLLRFLPDESERLDLLATVWQEASRHDLDPDLAMAVIEVESSFNRFAISTAGAQGLMQVMPFWKNEIGRPDDNLMDTRTNVRYGMTILAHYLEREGSDVVRALTRYHGDRRDLSYPDRVFRAWNARWRTRDRGEVREFLAACYQAGLDHCD